MKLKNLKVKSKILLFVLPLVIVSLVSVSMFWYCFEKQNLLDNYNQQKNQVEAHVVNAVNLINSGYSMLENSVETQMEEGIIEFKNEFEKAGADPEKISLEELKQKIGDKYELIIIDENTSIIKSTDPSGLNFNFMAFDRKIGEEITKARLGDYVRHEHIRTNVGTGLLSKFAYIPTSDHKYLLEIEYSEGGLRDIVSSMEPLKVTSGLVASNPIVSSIRIFDVYGYEFTDSGQNYEPTDESLQIVGQAKLQRKYEVQEGNKVKSYIYIDLSSSKYKMSDNSKVVEIIYDKTDFIQQINKLAFLTLAAGFVVIPLLIFLIFYLSRRITYPITLLAKAAKDIENGDYSIVAKKVSNDEIGELSDTFNSMILRIRDNFVKIENQKKELKEYNKNLEAMVDERETSLREERELLKATLLSIGDGVITTDKTGRVFMMNEVAEDLTGVTQEEAFGKLFDEAFVFINEDTRRKWDNPINTILETGEADGDNQQIILVSKAGRRVPIEKNASPIIDENEKVSGVILVFRDFTEKKEKQDKIEYLNLHDQLTGLYNRRFFEEELKRLDTPKNVPLTIIMMDVNGLKLINDAFGHSVGDKTLQKAAEVMKSQCGNDDIVSRLGGDEFVILLPGTGAEEAATLVEQFYEVFESSTEEPFKISVSCGFATKESEMESLRSIFKLAEDGMYRRKLSESRSMHYKTIDTIIKTLHGKSEREKKHSERVGELCEEIGSALRLSPEDVREFKTIGLMHDIGKIAIDLSILDKPGSLTESERDEIERHPELGYQILRSINDFAKLAGFVLCHHERWDGKGYPRKLRAEEIPIEARILAVADAYDSMTSDRAYRAAMNQDDAIMEIKQNAGLQFDPYIAKVFVEQVLNTKW